MNDAFRMFDLTGKTALVTGGSTGIGYNISRALARAGAKVMITARRENLLKEAAKKLASEAFGNEVLYHPVDLADNGSVDALARHALKTLGGVDIFVGNAAMISFEPVHAIQDETLEQMLRVNVASNVRLVRAFLPSMRAKKWGRVIFSSSVSSLHGTANEASSSIYSTVKGALNSYAHAAAAEMGHDGVTVNTIILGPFSTEMWRDMCAQVEQLHGPGAGQAQEDGLASMTALGRLARCEEVEGIIQFLASDAASYVTGANLAMDGGMSIMMLPNTVKH